MCSRFCIFTLLLREAAMGSAQGEKLCFWHNKKNKKPAPRSANSLRGCKLSGSTRKKELCDNWASPACLQPSFRNKWDAAQTCEVFIFAADDNSDAKRLADFDRSCETLATESQHVAVDSRLQTPFSRYSKKNYTEDGEGAEGGGGRGEAKQQKKRKISN